MEGNNHMKIKIGDKNYIEYNGNGNKKIDTIFQSWEKHDFKYPKELGEKAGFRSPQLGAIYAIKSHWTVSNSAATIVMPTGTGKTEVMIATVVSEKCKKTCVIVPSDLLRKQTVERFCNLGKLREIGAIDNRFLNPLIGCLKSSPKNIGELQELIENCNVIVTTMSLLGSSNFPKEYINLMCYYCDTLIIDEAHHLPSSSWDRVKKCFHQSKCIQFTATPFRNDGKKVDGEIIYNFPLALAQEQGYFMPINFYPIYEFDEDKRDYAVALKAIEILKKDISKNLPHLLLVRAATQERAKDLFDNVYNKYFNEFFPFLIISNNTQSEKKDCLNKVYNGTSKIIVCVDMFREGIDIPQLKICAIHDKYKSLPITIQFIGRFARAKDGLGAASVVANIVDEDIQESLSDLYSQDADWNKILKDCSDEKIGREVELQKLSAGFIGTEKIPLNQLVPKVSMFMYTTVEDKWNWQKWNTIFDEECCHHYVNEKEKILVITEMRTSKVEWTTCKDVCNKNWNLHIIYWNERKKILFINTTDKGIADRFAEAIFGNVNRITGENVFKCLYGINRLMLSSVGLKTVISSHHIRYRMFAGVDIAEGITGANKESSTKSNIFGVGYENGESVSIGCSYKGTIWAKWVETINFWKTWCDKQAEKILNPLIDTQDLLKGVLIPKEVHERPDGMPYRIDFPMELEMDWNGSFDIRAFNGEGIVQDYDIILKDPDESSDIVFYVGNNQIYEEFCLKIFPGNYRFEHKAGSVLYVYYKNSYKCELKDFFKDYPPIIWFTNGASLEGNYFIQSNTTKSVDFDNSKIITWDWTGTDITVESQDEEKKPNSIQYRTIKELKQKNIYSLIFDDDGSGEVADVVAAIEDDEKREIIFELYHCKYSHGKVAGSRLIDLYEVCGQAEKSIKWTKNIPEMLNHLLQRDVKRQKSKCMSSRFEIGDSKVIMRLKNKMRFYPVRFNVFIVQPGVDSKRITPEMNRLLCCSEGYLSDISAIPLKIICS